MKYKIVVDNTCELTDKIRTCNYVDIIKPTDIDKADKNNSKYLKVILNSLQCDKNSCIAPEDFKKAYETDADVIFVVTMSSKLCSAFSSAAIGRSLYFEEHGEDKIIKVINSNAAGCGEAVITENIIDSIESGCQPKQICDNVKLLKKEQNGRFVAETLEYIKSFGMTGMRPDLSAV